MSSSTIWTEFKDEDTETQTKIIPQLREEPSLRKKEDFMNRKEEMANRRKTVQITPSKKTKNEPLLRPSSEIFSNDMASRTSSEITSRSSGLKGSTKVKILQLPRSILTKILSYLDAKDLVNTYQVCLQFQIVTKQITRARWQTIVPKVLNPRPTMLSSKSVKDLREVIPIEVAPVETKSRIIGTDQLKALFSSAEWKKLAAKIFPDSLLEFIKDEEKDETKLTKNPFSYSSTFVDSQMFTNVGSITSLTTSNPLPVVLVNISYQFFPFVFNFFFFFKAWNYERTYTC